MPTVKKQTPTVRPRTAAKVSAVDRIQPVGQYVEGIRLSSYGRGKTGKTRLFCTFPKPALLIGTEDGTKSIASVKGLDFVKIRASSEIDELAAAVGGRYKSVGLDHASGLQDLILKEILGLAEVPVQRSWGMAKREDWMVCGMQMKERLRTLLLLSETHGVDVDIIAHERNFSDEGADSELLFPTVGSALSPSVAGWLNGAVDYVCQTYIREQTTSVTTKQLGKDVTMLQKTGKKEFCLRVGPHPVFMTGFRLPPGTTLPEAIVDPSYAKIVALIKGQA